MARVADIGQLHLLAAALVAQRQHRAEVVVRHHDRRLDPRLLDVVDHAAGSGMSAGLCSSSIVAVGRWTLVDDRGRGRDQVEVELARQPLLDDLEVQQAEEAAAEAEAQRRRGLRSRSGSWRRSAAACRAIRAASRSRRRRPGTGRRTPPAWTA